MAFWIPIKYVSSWVKFKAVEFNLFLKKFSACRLLVFNSEIHGSSPLLHAWHPALTQSAPCTPEGWRAPGRMTTLWDKHQQWKNLKRLFYLPDTISQAIVQICLCVQLVKSKVSSPMCKRAGKQRTQTRILSYGKPHWAPEWGLSKQPLFVSVSKCCRCSHAISKVRIISEKQVHRNTLFSDASSAECSKTTQRKHVKPKVRAAIRKNHPTKIRRPQWPD